MANKKIQIIPPDGGYVDVLHPETTASQVIEETNKKFMTDAEKTKLSNLSTVATSGSYADLSDKPTIPDTSGLMPKSGGVLENYREKLVTVSESEDGILLQLNEGNVFVCTVPDEPTPIVWRNIQISQSLSGAHSFTLIVNMSGPVKTLTFPASVKWQGGEIPDMSTASKTYVLTFLTVDGGTNWLGMFGGEF